MEPPIGEKLVEILPRLRLYARSLVFSEADADDLVQKTCVRALERQAQFQRGTSLIAWAITIMKNIQKDMWKRPISDEGSETPTPATGKWQERI